MKTKLLFLISFFAYQSLFAQTGTGISVQGIARDSEKAALVDELLTFTFDIQDPDDGHSYYKEDVEIKTDPYGVFSHIIGTSSNKTGVFEEIPFGQAHMKLVISVNGGEIISDSPFQYAPYAKSAENGVPTGTIVAYAGTEANIPKGWTLCDGRDLAGVEDAANLIALFEAQNKPTNAPDLRGMFLRGADTNGNAAFADNVGPALGETQEDGFEEHSHDKGTLNIPANSGGHQHNLVLLKDKTYDDGDDGTTHYYGDDNGGSDTKTITGGGHDHSITGETGDTGIGINETRPVNYGVNYIIKL